VEVFDKKVGISGLAFLIPTTSSSTCTSINILNFIHIGIRYGHFNAFTLIDKLSPKLDTRAVDGVVRTRISLAHYNTIIEILKEIR
jgi:hypothetical protein